MITTYTHSNTNHDNNNDNDNITITLKQTREVQGCVGKEAEMVSSIGKELLVQVPFNAADRFPALFSTIDKECFRPVSVNYMREYDS